MTRTIIGLPTATFLLISAAGTIGCVEAVRAEVTGNIGVVSNYFFRGFSETDGGAAVQGGLDFETDGGIYLGTWASNVDFGDGTTYELDLYLGFAGELGNGLGYDVGYNQYLYPDAPGSSSFGEVYGELSFGLFSGGLAYPIHDSSDSALETGDLYFHAAIEFALVDDYSLGFLVGRTAFDDAEAESYTHFTATLGKETAALGAFSLNMEYEDTFDKDLKAWVGWSLAF